MSPPIEQLLDKVDSKFSLVTLAARRARDINAYLSHLGGNLGSIVPPQLESISKKPLSVSFEEIAASLVVPIRIEEPVEESLVDGGEFDLGEEELELDSESLSIEAIVESVPTD